MSINTPLSNFFNALNDEESEFAPELASDKLGLILRSAVNELDWYYYNFSKEENPSSDQEEEFYLLKLGVCRLIKIALESRTSFDVPTVMFIRRREITIPVLQIAAGLGMIEHGRRVGQSVSAGLCTIEQKSEKDFLITLPSSVPDEDYYERSVSDHYKNESRRRFAQYLHSEAGKKIALDVEKKLHELVFPFETHFIGYGADLLLDDYFFGLAYNEVHLCDGVDTFHYSICFGGIQFQKYIFALTYFISIFTRHEKFAETLVKKVPSIKLENILTISSETGSFVESIRDALNHFGYGFKGFNETSLEDARKIFEVLSCSRKNTNLLDRPGTQIPLIIQSSDNGFFRCLTGAHTGPMQFLLDSLRHHYPKEYDRHQQSREKTMQVAIKRVLNGGFDGLSYRENVKVRMGGRVVTDIDLVVMEPATGTIFLCQLKHQDLYGADLASKHIRTSRLKDQVSRWLTTLEDWIESVGEAGIRSSLQLHRHFPPLSVYRVVISRHYGYPLRELAKKDHTAYANWNQFFNSIELIKQGMTKGTLVDLIGMLKKTEQPGGIQEYSYEPKSEWRIRNLKFTVRQDQAGGETDTN